MFLRNTVFCLFNQFLFFLMLHAVYRMIYQNPKLFFSRNSLNVPNVKLPEHYTSVRKYWKIPFYLSNTDTGTFYGGSNDIDTDVQYPKFNTDILVFPVFSSIIILCCKPFFDICYLRSHALITS